MDISLQKEVKDRHINRICHFTPFDNFMRIIGGSYGILSKEKLKQRNLPYTENDKWRYDNRKDKICCSIEYPNPFFIESIEIKGGAVIFIKKHYLWDKNTEFCPCNAAFERGKHINGGVSGFRALYASSSPRDNRIYRNKNHLYSVPTDIQAEALIEGPISINSMIGVAVFSEKHAITLSDEIEKLGIDFKKPISIAPDLYSSERLPQFIQQNERVEEKKYFSI